MAAEADTATRAERLPNPWDDAATRGMSEPPGA